jgi:cytoskeleton protein RodZ
MDIGKHLRETRELRGMTLQQVADSTKLSAKTLHYIERNEFNRLPGGIFTKGHLRAYAAEVGAEPDEVVHEYVSQFPGATGELPIVRAPAIENAHAGRHLLLTVAGIVLAVVAYKVVLDSVEWSDSSPPELIQARASNESIATESARLGSRPTTEREQPRLDLKIHPTGTCWLSATADGSLVIHRLLQRGERVTVVGRNELVLRIGDPAMFAYTLNGVSGRPLGQAGQAVTVTITEKNYQTFLAASVPETPREVFPNAT